MSFPSTDLCARQRAPSSLNLHPPGAFEFPVHLAGPLQLQKGPSDSGPEVPSQRRLPAGRVKRNGFLMPCGCRPSFYPRESETYLQISREHVFQLALFATPSLLLLLLIPLSKAWFHRALCRQISRHHYGQRRRAQAFWRLQAWQGQLCGETTPNYSFPTQLNLPPTLPLK